MSSASPFAPVRPPHHTADAYPESWQYLLKNKLLGPPLVSEQLGHQRLSKPVAFVLLACYVAWLGYTATL